MQDFFKFFLKLFARKNEMISEKTYKITRKVKLKTKQQGKGDKGTMQNIPNFATQFPGHTEKKTSDIVIGFDLGTSTTKVVLRDPWARRVYAIPFSNTSTPMADSYLLRTRLTIDKDGCFRVPNKSDHWYLRNLKMTLLDDYKKIVYSDPSRCISINSFVAASIYIACVLRYVRQWFFKDCSAIYKNNKINWQFQLGIPTKNYDDIETKDIFRKCAIAGWWLSVQESPIDISLVNQMINDIKKESFNPGIHPDHVNVFPEVAAEVAGYARSPRRDNGLHLLIDIGARTLDVSTFVLHGKGEQQYAFLETKVERLGAFEVHKKRIEKMTYVLKNTPHFKTWAQHSAKLDDAALPVPKSLRTYCGFVPPSLRKTIFNELKLLDEQLNKYIHIAICSVVSETKRRRDPLSSRWQEGLPVFICGGGSALAFYRDVINDSEKSMQRIGCNCFRTMDLQPPEGLRAKGLDHTNYHRIAVAYGLSFPYEDIGTIIPPSEVEDIEQQVRTRDTDKDFISKDMV